MRKGKEGKGKGLFLKLVLGQFKEVINARFGPARVSAWVSAAAYLLSSALVLGWY